ncbi:SET and MYND domain-containing protein 4-like [Copidosoma floridanum]|uniref:SET and MYND domain-containing protein 4-like n=1 Tax=Copidosoma floridanum TaxID=29053 RepID=UPI0006C96B91|nr:SET and MYND domain-containing protein 4-like [Copidosoma floridanum]
MMESRRRSASYSCGGRRGLLGEFEYTTAQQLNSDESFKARFGELSRAGNQTGMVAAVLDALEAHPKVGDCFRGKDEKKTAQLLQQDQAQEEPDPQLLAKALGIAPAGSRLFYDVLAECARAAYLAGDPLRCIKYCRLFTESLDRQEDGQPESPPVAENARIDVLLLQADCCKAFRDAIGARSLLNEAMRRIGLMAKGRCIGGDDESYKLEKAELLNKFLQRKPRKTPMPDDAAWDLLRQEKIVTPTVDGKPNEYLRSCSDAVALGNDKIKGRKLYATRKIKAGSVLIVDRPYSYCTDLAAIQTNCLYCHASLRLDSNIRVPCESCQTVQFCSKDCQQLAWSKFHKYECRIFDYFFDSKIQRINALLAYRTVVTAANFDFQDNVLRINRDFLQLHNSHDKNTFDFNALKKYDSQDYKTVFSLETHCSDADPSENLERVVYAIFFAKCLIYSLNYFYPEADDYKGHLHVLAVALLHSMQAVNCNAYEIVENVRDDETKVLQPRNVGGAIYTSVSLTNHSCYPNVVRHSYSCGTVVVRSLRFIAQGEEILDCYGQHFLENERDTRRKLLEKKYYFKCQCMACTFDWPVTLPNDQFDFKCKKCSQACRKNHVLAECANCGRKTEISKLYGLLQSSIKKRLTALTRMYDGNYKDALPLLLEHAHCIDKILSEPSLEIIKTQQSIIQCLNAMSSTSI